MSGMADGTANVVTFLPRINNTIVHRGWALLIWIVLSRGGAGFTFKASPALQGWLYSLVHQKRNKEETKDIFFVKPHMSLHPF